MSRHRSFYRPPPPTLSDGRYEVGAVIGAGGMATVYSVRDRETGAVHAAKILKEVAASRSKTRQRFLTEARTMASLDHRHICTIYDVGEEDGVYYFVMEYAAGGALSSRMRRFGSLPTLDALRYAFQALAGLDHAHRAGVIHRDIKPHNILLTGPEDPDPDAVRLTDFGIARVMTDGALRITGTGDMLGTLAYMSPEQRLDPRRVGPQADIYSIGALLYLAITGRRPIELSMGRFDASIFERLPDPVRPVVAKATAHDPGERYATARAMAAEVAAVIEELEPAVSAADWMERFDDDPESDPAGPTT